MKITAITTTKSRNSQKYWAINVPEVGYMTQAKRLTEVESAARSLASEILSVDPDSVEVNITVTLPKDLADKVDGAKLKMRAAQAQLEAASKASRLAIKKLRAEGFTVREVAKLMDLSPGRVTQLEHHSINVQGVTVSNARTSIAQYAVKAADTSDNENGQANSLGANTTS